MDSDKEKDEKVEDAPKDEEKTSTDAPETTSSGPQQEQDTPADALSRTPEELAEEAAENGTAEPEEPVKKLTFWQKIFRKVNVYFLIFIMLAVVAGAITVVNYLNSQKGPTEPSLVNQELDEDTLKQLANNDATVGNTSQTLTIQGNAVIAGQTLMRGNLNVAGNFQTGGSIQGPSLTISGQSNLGQTQISDLQIGTNLAVQGNSTMRDINVAGTSTFNGNMTASQITVSKLIISGNGTLEVPNHIGFTGPTPTLAVNGGVVGGGGSVSISGSDTAGVLNINTGNNPTAGCFARVNFRQAFTSQPRVLVSPVGVSASKVEYYVDRTTSGFSICSGNTPPNNALFYFDFFVVN